LGDLLERGKVNGVNLEKISVKEAKDIELRAKTQNHALFSPSTSSIDPIETMYS
jgi:hypothetical protein